jgi:hypothetical protein
MQNIMVILNIKGMTVEQYEKSVTDLQAANALKSSNQLYHVAGQTTDGMVVVDVWESHKDFEKFGEKLIPILENIGVTLPKPEIIPVHNIILYGNYFMTKDFVFHKQS